MEDVLWRPLRATKVRVPMDQCAFDLANDAAVTVCDGPDGVIDGLIGDLR